MATLSQSASSGAGRDGALPSPFGATFPLAWAGTQTDFPEAVDRSTCYPFGNRDLVGLRAGEQQRLFLAAIFGCPLARQTNN
jgi:hypothetical protein